MKRPVMATTAGSLPEVVFGRYVLVEPKDPTALAEGIIRIHAKNYSVSPEKRFTWDDNILRHIEAYKRLLQREPVSDAD
jgi:glycosyltransferase involved in cell wall biosynthesis